MRALALALPVVLALAAAAPALSQPSKPSSPAPGSAALKDPTAQSSYAFGLNLGANLRRAGVSVDPALLAKGLQDALSGATPALTDDEVHQALMRLQAQVQAGRAQQAAQAAETNKTEGQAFLKANQSKPGIVTLPSGLEYQVLTQGTGPKPKATDSVICNYTGTLLDGTQFDSSARHGGPATFPVEGVIKGWTEALQLMPAGSKWRIFVPSDLAYGPQGAGQDIGPNAVLVFEIELVSVQPGA
jgi:FKBP-type peptidyl-prolyl cis-trans isomerase FklB